MDKRSADATPPSDTGDDTGDEAEASPEPVHYPERRKHRRGKREAEHLQLARLVQAALLPPPEFEVPGFQLAMRYLPSYELGGDFCDYFVLEDNSLGLYLGDVQGKGVGAALYALLANGIIRGIHKSGHLPADVMCLLNQRISFRNVPDRFSCLGYATIGLEDRRLTFCSAGIPFPLLLRRGKIIRLELTGVPVGLFQAGHYDQITLDLEPGDNLLFHSDGVADSLAPRNDPALDGERKLERLFQKVADHSAVELADALKAKLEGNARHKRRLRDDATFIIIHVL